MSEVHEASQFSNVRACMWLQTPSRVKHGLTFTCFPPNVVWQIATHDDSQSPWGDQHVDAIRPTRNQVSCRCDHAASCVRARALAIPLGLASSQASGACKRPQPYSCSRWHSRGYGTHMLLVVVRCAAYKALIARRCLPITS